MDVLLCTETLAETAPLLGAVVRRLHSDGLLTHDLGGHGRFGSAPERSATYLGVCRVNETYRRIDIKVWPQASFALALLHFTGSGHFNREMRLYAKRNGYHLSDHELRRLADGYEPPLATEADVFAALGLHYVSPELRAGGQRRVRTLPDANMRVRYD